MAVDEVTQDLENLEIRYGRLVGQEEKIDFGTVGNVGFAEAKVT